MSNKVGREGAKPSDLAADDFKLIKGIGPGVEQRLHNAGIMTYARLAALSPADIAALTSDITGLSTERVIKQDWIGQAKRLAAGIEIQTEDHAPPTILPEVELPEPEEIKPEVAVEPASARPGNVTFTVELVLDEEQHVTTTRVKHEESATEESWEDWQPVCLLRFFEVKAELNPTDIMLPIKGKAESDPADNPPSTPGPEVKRPVPKLVKLEKLSPETNQASNLVKAQQSFEARVQLDLSELALPSELVLDYVLAIYAKRLGNNGQHQEIGEASGMIAAANELYFMVACHGLEIGAYRLEATIKLIVPVQSGTVQELDAMLEGSLIQVY